MGDFNAKVGGQTNTSERATGCFGLGQRNERGDTLVEWATSKNFKIMNTQFKKKAGRRWTWRSPGGNTKNEIDYIMTDKPSMVTDVTVINRVNIGSDHRMVMGSITLNTRAERRKLLNKNTRTRVDTQMIGTKKNTFQLELKNRFTALEEHDDMDSLNKDMTEMIQQSALSIAKQTKKQKNPKISSPTRALMKKRREMIENKTPRDHIEYVEICKTIKKKAKEDIRKHNLDEIRETIEASKNLKKTRRTHSLGKNRMITLLDKQGRDIQEQDKIMERIEEFYSELFDSDQAVTIQTDPKEVPPIMAWEVELLYFSQVRCSIYRYVNKYNLPLTVLLHATCYTPFHGARERVTSGGAVWLVVRVVFVVAINTCNTLQWRRVRDTNSCRRLITCSSGIRDK